MRVSEGWMETICLHASSATRVKHCSKLFLTLQTCSALVCTGAESRRPFRICSFLLPFTHLQRLAFSSTSGQWVFSYLIFAKCNSTNSLFSFCTFDPWNWVELDSWVDRLKRHSMRWRLTNRMQRREWAIFIPTSCLQQDFRIRDLHCVVVLRHPYWKIRAKRLFGITTPQFLQKLSWTMSQNVQVHRMRLASQLDCVILGAPHSQS